MCIMILVVALEESYLRVSTLFSQTHDKIPQNKIYILHNVIVIMYCYKNKKRALSHPYLEEKCF